MFEKDTGSAEANTDADAGAGKSQSGLGDVAAVMSDIAGRISEFGNGLAAIPGFEKLAEPLTTISEMATNAADIVANAAAAADEGKATGGIGVVLGVAESILGGLTGGSSGGEDDGEEGEGFLEKAKGVVGQLKGIWTEYYDDLFTKDKKLNLEKAKNMALEVGDVILGSKKMAKVKKALAIANVVRGVAESVVTASKSTAFPFNLPAIAIAKALGAAQLSTVKGQAHDGIKSIPSTGTYLLEQGERVVDNRLNGDLSEFLKVQNAVASRQNIVSAQGADSFRNDNRSVTNAPVINLSFGSDTDENTVANNRGAVETMIREIFADYAMDAPFG